MVFIELAVMERDILGKKVRFLRRQGITPVHVFGHNITSVALQCDTVQLRHALAEAGRTRLISLKTDKSNEPTNVVVREVQKDPLTGELLHVDFYQVKMEEKITVEVPINIVGEAPALKFKENTLVQEMNTIEIECLPNDIPPDIEIDVSSLSEPDAMIRVKDIALSEKITVLDEPEQVVAKISVQPLEEIEEEVAEEEVEEKEMAEAAPTPVEAKKEQEKEKEEE